MKRRYIFYRRKRGGMFYIEDIETPKAGKHRHEESRRGHVAAQRQQ
jgi:hypothetical protein